ncbi:Multiple C2 and transmembrane domain-containing protein 1, partial [Cichlidogyrus casuarinus]
MLDSLRQGYDCVNSWEYPRFSLCCFTIFQIVVWTFQPHMLPMLVLLAFVWSRLTQGLRSFKMSLATITNRRKHSDSSLLDDIDSDNADELEEEVENAKSNPNPNQEESPINKSEKTSLKEKYNYATGLILRLQSFLDTVASFLERLSGAFEWTVPWLSWFAVIVMIGATIILYLVPLRTLLSLVGLKKFLKTAIRRICKFQPKCMICLIDYLRAVRDNKEPPHHRSNNELFSYLYRVPCLTDLDRYKNCK